jgi:catechol 2,3-dioxygenase-like lactoylglutathione lyase family enzyme
VEVAVDEHRLSVVEPATGVLVGVEVAGPVGSPEPAEPDRNRPGRVDRWDVPAAAVLADGPVRPSNLTHLVLGTPDLAASLEFFCDLLGFRISDEVPGVIAFTRCGEVHHQLALQQAPGTILHHVAFEVDDVDDVARGGTRMIDADGERHLWGMGRHAIGSNWFWYLREPGGHYVEYAADVDRISDHDAYRPGDWSGHDVLYAFGPPPPIEFLEPADAAAILAAQAG